MATMHVLEKPLCNAHHRISSQGAACHAMQATCTFLMLTAAHGAEILHAFPAWQSWCLSGIQAAWLRASSMSLEGGPCASALALPLVRSVITPSPLQGCIAQCALGINNTSLPDTQAGMVASTICVEQSAMYPVFELFSRGSPRYSSPIIKHMILDLVKGHLCSLQLLYFIYHLPYWCWRQALEC